MSDTLPIPAAELGLAVDLYELTMAQGYDAHGRDDVATFDLFVRRLPQRRRFALAVGLGPALLAAESARFGQEAIEFLRSTGRFSTPFLARLAEWRFTGDIDAVPEGTVVFGGEPVLRVTASLFDAQLLETLLVNQVHLGLVLASKAARIVLAARGRSVVDFGLRRTHGLEAGLAAARAAWIAGFGATSNVLAGRRFGIPLAGTMAHSWIQAHDDEREAFLRFAATFPDTILLIDTYETQRGCDLVIDLARSLGEQFRVRGVRLDSGDLAAEARSVRARLDRAGLQRMEIFASGNLDEDRVAALVAARAPIDGFGVGTRFGTSEDEPNLDVVYKLAQVGSRPVLKLSPGKETLPGIKQVWRTDDRKGRLVGDMIGLAEETLPGRPLLRPAMREGERLEAAVEPLDAIRARAAEELEHLPNVRKRLEPSPYPEPVATSERLLALRDRIAGEAERDRG